MGRASSSWRQVVNAGIGYSYRGSGKGTLYAIAGGNGRVSGDNANLDEYTNDYGVTAVCTVNDHHARSDQPEMAANLWVRSPSYDFRDEHLGLVTTEISDRYADDSGINGGPRWGGGGSTDAQRRPGADQARPETATVRFGTK